MEENISVLVRIRPLQVSPFSSISIFHNLHMFYILYLYKLFNNYFFNMLII